MSAAGDASTLIRAFVDLYREIDGAVDDLSARDFRLTQEFAALYQEAIDYLTTCETCGRPADWEGDSCPGAPCMGCGRYPAARLAPSVDEVTP